MLAPLFAYIYNDSEQLKVVTFKINGKFIAESDERFHRQLCLNGYRCDNRFNSMAFRLDYVGCAGVDSEFVGTRAVASYDIGLILDGPCYEQLLPGVGARVGPVGHYDKQVVGFATVAEPCREAEIEANGKGHIPSTEGHDGHRA